MKIWSGLIARYILQTVTPYFIFTWILLSVILFVQQGSRYSDIIFSANIPTGLIWQLTFALAPNVIAFTCPMAILIGVIIGLSKMQGDSELIAVRAAGVGNFQIVVPILLLGFFLSIFAFFINLRGVPFAARIVRQVAVQAAIYKLESPIEPGVFNTEINDYTVYVKDGDVEKGTWKNVFIYNEDKKSNSTRLITSKSGRIDFEADSNELVLENAVITTISDADAPVKNAITASSGAKPKKYVSENVGRIRLAIQTKRGELIEKVSNSEQTPDELGISELARYAETKSGRQKIEAQVLMLRRLILSITPLIFAVLGAALILRFNRRGRGFGIFLALVSLIGYYLIALLGEQLARTEQISALAGSLLPLTASIAVIAWLFLANRIVLPSVFSIFSLNNIKIPFAVSDYTPGKIWKKNRISFAKTYSNSILDFDIVVSLLKYFFLTLGFLSAIYVIFTAFELWKFAGTIENGLFLLLKYLLFLVPFIYLQLAPSALMIATLATYVVKSRQNEIVTWTAAGLSVYRLLLPCFALMLLIGGLNWQLQERVLPSSNQQQDELRAVIRNRGIVAQKEKRYWVANDNRIYSFEIDGDTFARTQTIKNLSVYDFSAADSKLQTIYRIPQAVWKIDRVTFAVDAEKTSINEGVITTETLSGGELAENENPFQELYKKPTHLTASETKQMMETSESEYEKRNYAVAFEKKYATLVLPFIITLFTAPFALSLSRKGKVLTIGYAVAVWLVFMGMTNVFEQLGVNGYLAPSFAVWSPIFLFAGIGIYLISKVKT